MAPADSLPDLDDLLTKTSRTFALSIPLLPEPTRRQVGVAYLLFRIADNFEDAAEWTEEQKVSALEIFCQLLAQPSFEEASRWAERWVAETPIDHAGYQELLAEVPAVLTAFFDLEPRARELVREHTVRTAEGMADVVRRTGGDGELELETLEDLRHYCYIVAGIVGEMLTELFVLGRGEMAGIAAFLRERSREFGEGLQLVNILKDCAFDATEGRTFLPPDVAVPDVFALARADLDRACEYINAMQDAGAERGLIAFNALNMLLAFASLDKLEREGPGSKISREEVYEIYEDLQRTLDVNGRVQSLVA